MLNTFIHQLFSVLAQPPFLFLYVCSNALLFAIVLSASVSYILTSCILFYICGLSSHPVGPPRHLKSSAVCRCFGEHAALSVTFYCGLYKRKANSSYSLPLLRAFPCCSVSALMCEVLPPVLHHYDHPELPRNAFRRLLWTISKTAWLKKKNLNSLPVLHISAVVA